MAHHASFFNRCISFFCERHRRPRSVVNSSQSIGAPLRARVEYDGARSIFWNFSPEIRSGGNAASTHADQRYREARQDVAIAAAKREACQPDFLEFFSRNSLRWKCGPDHTLTNGVGKQGKTGRPPRIQEARTRLSGKKIPEIRLQLAQFEHSGDAGVPRGNRHPRSKPGCAAAWRSCERS